jgi:signal transduction histidine kinase/DNA-binding response OmpR family regulator/ligand-binding sensor domain-containing protein
MSNFLKTNFLLFFLSLFLSNYINAQQIKHLNTNNGLITGTVRAFEKDSLGYLWVGTDQGLNRYSGVEFKNYDLQKFNQGKGIDDIINLNGELYFISINGTLFKYLYNFDRLDELLVLKNEVFLSLTSLGPSKLLIGLSAGFIIFDTKTNQASEVILPKISINRDVHFANGYAYSATPKGIFVFEYKNNTLVYKETFLQKEDIIDLAFDHKNRIWAGTEVGGLYIIDKKEIKNIGFNQTFNKTYAIRKIDFDKKNNALIAIDRLGLFVLNENFEIIKSYSHDVDNTNSLSQNSIYEIYVDNANTYWLGVREGGINIVYEKNNVFNNISHIQNKKNSIHNNNIRSIFESSSGDIMFGTENGISKYSSDENWVNYNKSSVLFNTAVLTINEYNNNLLLGTYGEGVLSFNPRTNKISEIELTPKLPLKFIFNLYNFENNLWVGASDGPLAHYFDDKLIHKYSVGIVKSIVKGFDEINYVGSDLGFFEINKRNKSIRKIKEDILNSLSEIQDLNFDPLNNCIWIGSKNGIFRFNLSTEEIENLNAKTNIEIGTVFSLERDNMQNLYLGAISGLWKYDIRKKTFRKYNEQDGLLINEFDIGAASTKFRDGRLAFGGPNGAVIFNPIDLIKEEAISDIFISNFQINGKNLDAIAIKENINYKEKLVLDYNQNTISFNYETIKFHGSKRNIFSWKLDGVDEEYKRVLSNEKITYSNIAPGNYNLHVQAFNVDGLKGKSDYTIEIIIRNPFWKTWWAFIFYALITSIIIYLIFRIIRANGRNKFDENRIKFFVEVAHDIRTPVSLIQLLVKQLSDQQNIKKSIELIQRNTENLNEYVTQLLDFQKIDRKQLKLSVSQVDLKECFVKIIDNFTPILQEKSIDIILDIKHIPVWFDASKMNRIFYNLISNAIKYSNEGGEIKIQAYLSANLRIDFIDNGMGIPDKQQELVFKRFTRGTNVSNKGIPGTGIGLLLSKKIVELHGGKILLESKENIGSKFTIVLPNGTEHYSKEELILESKTDSKIKNVKELITKNKLILLIEDNLELRDAIKNEIDNIYTVLEASNGKEGLLIALSKSPDIIITDVMMPEMDGKELCNLLKTNFKTSHIPIIMLSALVDIDQKLQGLETGADAYIEKPFNVEILKATIHNLIKSRENITRLLEDKKVKKQLTPDESFLSDIINVIKKNLTEQDFSIDHLCKIMGLSRSNLFRKLKGLIQMSPSDLIVKIKLGHAEELMKNNTFTRISDIAYESGFHDPKYFSTLFKKHYSKTPKEYMDNQ